MPTFFIEVLMWLKSINWLWCYCSFLACFLFFLHSLRGGKNLCVCVGFFCNCCAFHYLKISGAWFGTTTKVLLPSYDLAELNKTNFIEKSPVFISPNCVKVPNKWSLFLSSLRKQNRTKIWSITNEHKAELT